MANNFFLLTWYERDHLLPLVGFLGIALLSESTFREKGMGKNIANEQWSRVGYACA